MRDFLTWAVLASVALLIALIAYRAVVPSEETLHARKVSAALLQCQQRILDQATYGDAETPPYVPNFGSKGEFYFAWQRGSFHFKNAYGVPEKMSASCIGDLETGEIKQLTVNTKTIL